jgi:hypothetical protein
MASLSPEERERIIESERLRISVRRSVRFERKLGCLKVLASLFSLWVIVLVAALLWEYWKTGTVRFDHKIPAGVAAPSRKSQRSAPRDPR